MIFDETNTDIFICTHKDIFDNKFNLHNPIYKVLTCKPIVNTSNLETIVFEELIENALWSEYSHIYSVYKNFPLKEYVGFCHYRRYFQFGDDFSWAKKFNNIDIIATEREMTVNNVFQWNKCHKPDDIVNFTDMILSDKSISNNVRQTWLRFINSNYFYSNSMFICRTEIFKKVCDELFSTMFTWQENTGIKDFTTWKKILNLYKNNYTKYFNPNNTTEYHERYFSYFSERLFGALMETEMLCHNSILEVPKIMVEDKYLNKY